MAFHLISSNRVELLKEQLAQLLMAQPLSSPLMVETILVPSMPMKRWLELQLAEHAGINCNNEYPLPAAWLWALLSSGLKQPNKPDPLAREHAAWRIYALLPDYIERPAFDALKHYLHNDAQGIKRWQLSERIADIFDRYQYYRPQMIRTWSAGGGDDWQAHLWRGLLAQVGEGGHRVALIDAFLLRLGQEKMQSLPERITIFAVSSLPPLLLQVIQAVAMYTDIFMFYLTPTDNYWADLKSGKAMARARLDAPDEVVYFETGHELLASWGRQGQVFQDLLLSDASLQSLDFECYHQQWPDTLLGLLQQDLFCINMDKREGMAADASLQLHICHSALRECQVLHDALLQRLQDDVSLKPEDILVMVPEISRYAPYIEAVFSKDEARPLIPWNLSDISVADEHPVIGSFLQLLQLPGSRFAISEVLALLDVPEICARFSLDSDKVAAIRQLLGKLHVRWGIDAGHKAEFGLPPMIENSWKQAELRLMAGFAMGESELWHGIAPVAIDHDEAVVMADFWALFELLSSWRMRLKEKTTRTALQWQAVLVELMESLFFDNHEKGGGHLQLIRDVLADLATHAGQGLLSLELVHHWLAGQLGERVSAGRYFSGGVSFCGMRPMRSLPFRVICLLGMQDAAFPGRERPLEFDHMVKPWQPGDPTRGEMDRYLMLETILCARDALYISYTGRSIRDNSDCQPSVLVQELMDQLLWQYGQVVVDAITYLHPMQPFSAGNYVANDRSFDAYWCRLANAMVAQQRLPDQGPKGWPQQQLEIENQPDEGVELSRLCRFVVHPVKFFFNHTLSIYLQQQDEIPDDEPFTLNGLERWQVKTRLMDQFIERGRCDPERLRAEAMLPHGALADHQLAIEQQQIAPVLALLEPYQLLKRSPRLIELYCPLTEGGGQLLSGQIQHYYPGRGLMHSTPSGFSSKYLMPLWIEHLAMCAAGRLPAGENSQLICRDESFICNRLTVEEAMSLLQQYLDAYRQGSRCPLPVFQKASWKYASQVYANQKSSPPLSEWSGNEHQNIPGDRDDPYVALVMRSVTSVPVEESCFSTWAMNFYQPVLSARGVS